MNTAVQPAPDHSHEEKQMEDRRRAEELRAQQAAAQNSQQKSGSGQQSRMDPESAASVKRLRESYKEATRIKLLQKETARIEEAWLTFQKIKFLAPPTLLPFEAERALQAFVDYWVDSGQAAVQKEVVDAFMSRISSAAAEGNLLASLLAESLHSVSPFSGFSNRVLPGKIREILRKCVVSPDMPILGDQARKAIEETQRLLRSGLGSEVERGECAVFSIHRFAGKCVIHIGSGRFGSIFITLPHTMEPEAMAQALLDAIKKASARFIESDNTIAVIDGDHQELNLQRVFKTNIVVRSSSADCDRFVLNYRTLLERHPPTAKNSALHFGLPASELELRSVFRETESGRPDWNDWSEIAPLWQERAEAQGFELVQSATAAQVITSLTQSENVIIVVAHGDRRTIHLPAPPPVGSELTAEEIMSHKAEITKNRPVVYLFCCETADISDLKSFSEVLLDAGAAAVFAPQTRIEAERSADLFEGVVRSDEDSGVLHNSLTKFHEAVELSNYREMEVFLG